jgi:hypothetical protein
VLRRVMAGVHGPGSERSHSTWMIFQFAATV